MQILDPQRNAAELRFGTGIGHVSLSTEAKGNHGEATLPAPQKTVCDLTVISLRSRIEVFTEGFVRQVAVIRV